MEGMYIVLGGVAEEQGQQAQRTGQEAAEVAPHHQVITPWSI